MKYLIKNIFLTLIATVLVPGCSSNDDATNNSTPETENLRLIGYSRYATEYTVSYNNQGQVTNYNNDPSSLGTIIYNSDNKIIQCGPYNYTYNAQGRISKITAPDGSSISDYESTIVYNNAGLVGSQSFRFTYTSSNETTFVSRTYEYNANNQLVSISELESGTNNYTRDVISYDSNNNITQVKRQTSNDGISYTDDIIRSYTYDDKNNPGYLLLNDIEETSNLSLINLYPLDTFGFNNYAFFRLKYYSNNNIISSQRSGSFGTISKTYNYVYNDKEYPTSVEITTTDIDNTTTTGYKTWTYETY